MSFSLGVALDSPALTAAEWIGQARIADEARLDYLSIEDTFGPPADGSPRLEASLVAALLGPVTRHVGLIPVLTTTHTEPFHLSTALATVDWVSRGRGGWQARVSADGHELLGRREPLGPADLIAEAEDVVEVVRRLWDSWQDDAIIKDVPTGRYIDRDRLHHIDFAGRFFSVKGPSIVPRPPQGQPVVAVLAHHRRVYEFAARCADVVFVTPRDDTVDSVVAEVRAVPREGVPLHIVADVVLSPGVPATSDAHVHTGSAGELAELLTAWHRRGVDGFRIRGGLEAVARELVPLLGGHFTPRGATLRDRFGLPPAINRYEEARGA